MTETITIELSSKIKLSDEVSHELNVLRVLCNILSIVPEWSYIL